MVTLNKYTPDEPLDFDGLSTDTKPTGTYGSLKILNGSTFFAMDTQEVFFYDEGTESWLEQP